MKSQVLKNILTKSDVKILLDWFNRKDTLTDIRPNMTTKHINKQQKNVPIKLLEKITNKVIKEKHEVQIYSFIKQKFGWRVHADTGKNKKIHKGLIIPLEIDGSASTMFFDNYYTGSGPITFAKKRIPQFEYTLNIEGKDKYIKDLRKFKTKDKKVVKLLKELIKKKGKVGKRCYDYGKIQNLTNKPFAKKIHKKYASHIPYEDFHGLSLDKIVDWKVGDVISFDRTQLHCGTNTHREKTYISVFTIKK